MMVRIFDKMKSERKKLILSEADKFIRECEAYINNPAHKTKLGILKSNITKRFESQAINKNQKDNLISLILEKEDS